MKTQIKQRGESAAADLSGTIAGTVELLRERLADRLDDIDTKDLRKRADRMSDLVAGTLTGAIVDGIETARGRVRPSRRRVPVGMMVLGGMVIGAGVAAVILSRRPDVRQRAIELTNDVHQRVRSATDGGAGEESKLKLAVEKAIFAGEDLPAGQLRVDVEGRTVYLRGTLENRGYVDQAVRKAQDVDGVAAVINLVSA